MWQRRGWRRQVLAGGRALCSPTRCRHQADCAGSQSQRQAPVAGGESATLLWRRVCTMAGDCRPNRSPGDTVMANRQP